MASVPLRLRSSAMGNRVLARELLRRRRQYRPRGSQGERWEDVIGLMPGSVEVVRRERVIEREAFADGAALLAALRSRGAILALFGEEVDVRLAFQGPVEYEWPMALLWLRKF